MPASRAYESRTYVPSTSVSTNSAAPRIERSTWVSAAKLTIASAPAADSATASASQMSPTTSSASRPSRFARLPEYVSLSRTATSSPCATSRRTKCEPMNPAPPVTRIFIARKGIGRHTSGVRPWARMLAAAVGIVGGVVIAGTALIVMAFDEDEGSSDKGAGWMLLLGIAIVVVASAAFVWGRAVAALAVLLALAFVIGYSGYSPDGDGIYMVAGGVGLLAVGALELFRVGRGRREGPPASAAAPAPPAPSGAPSTPDAEPPPRTPPP